MSRPGRCSAPAADRGTADALYRASGGNPFYLEQLVRSAGPEALRAGLVDVDADGRRMCRPQWWRRSHGNSSASLPRRATVVQAAAVVGEPLSPM